MIQIDLGQDMPWPSIPLGTRLETNTPGRAFQGNDIPPFKSPSLDPKSSCVEVQGEAMEGARELVHSSTPESLT